MPSEVMNIIYLLIVILVPIVPAYLLFKKLRSTAKASGPISPVKEFSVKFGGAFAAYFPVFLLLYFKLPNTFTKDTAKQEVWKILGKVTDATTNRNIPATDADLELELDPFSKLKAGEFKFYLPSAKNGNEEELNYWLSIQDNTGKYLTSEPLYLDKFKDGNYKTKVINIPDSCLLLVKKTNTQADTASITEPMKELN